jgi:peptidyl-prolyl cis-trans isomerase C
MQSARGIALLVLLGVAGGSPAQQPAPPPPGPTGTPAPAPTAVAATVNNQNIPELAVFRALQRVPPSQRAAARKDVLNFLIDTALIDQYLDQLKVAVDAKEVDTAIKQMKDEAAKFKISWEDVLKTTLVTEPELRVQITNQLRWEKFAAQYATDKAVKDYFDQNKALFDGSQVRARHILLTPPADNPQAVEQARAKLAALQKLSGE